MSSPLQPPRSSRWRPQRRRGASIAVVDLKGKTVLSLVLVVGTTLLWIAALAPVPAVSGLAFGVKPPPNGGSTTAVGGKRSKYGGGRTPSVPDQLLTPSDEEDDDDDDDDEEEGGGEASPSTTTTRRRRKKRWAATPPQPSEARLTIIQITDVYTLDNFASLKTLLEETRERLMSSGNNKSGSNKVISVLTGDFLAPYLLSSIDRGAGMMNAIKRTPIDYLTWGNHEADIDHRTVCRHVKDYATSGTGEDDGKGGGGGTWLNSNMLDHDAMGYQKPFDIIDIVSPDGTNTRRIGLVAVLSDDPGLYAQFKQPGAFGGATIHDPWETLRKYKTLLEGPEYGCDVVIPLQHTYVPDDYKTCREFDFPVVLSGHDHHRVDEVVDGTRLLKPGLDGVYATVLELSWKEPQPDGDGDDSSRRPTVKARFVRCEDWDPDPVLAKENESAYDALLPLRNTELARVPPPFEPLSSVNSRGTVTTMGRFVCSLLRSSLNASRRQRDFSGKIDAVLLMGGNIRGGTDYPKGSFFSLEALEAEIKPDETVGVVRMPGWVLAKGISATHAGDPIPGWMQYDDGIKEEYSSPDGSSDGGPAAPTVTHVGGEPLEPDRIYRVATKIGDLTNGQSPPFTDYYTSHPELMPSKGAYVNIHAELMGFFARNLWRKIWENISPTDDDVLCGATVDEGGEDDGCFPEQRLATLDGDDDGIVTVDDIHNAVRDVLGLSVFHNEKTLARFIHNFADTTGDGTVTLKDFERFCVEMPQVYESQKWRLAFPKGGGDPAASKATSTVAQ